MSTDLASALVALAKAAEGRRTARKSLREATTTVADAILEELRVGDGITIGERYSVAKLGWYGRQGEGWPIVPSPDTFVGLIRGDALLSHDCRDDFWDGHNTQRPCLGFADFGDTLRPLETRDPAHQGIRLATDAERLAFAKEAGAVIAAFRTQLETERAAFEEGAAGIVQLAPRG